MSRVYALLVLACASGCIDIDELSRFYDGAVPGDLSANVDLAGDDKELGDHVDGGLIGVDGAVQPPTCTFGTEEMFAPSLSTKPLSIPISAIGGGSFVAAVPDDKTTSALVFDATTTGAVAGHSFFTCTNQCRSVRLSNRVGTNIFGSYVDGSSNFISVVKFTASTPELMSSVGNVMCDTAPSVTSTDLVATSGGVIVVGTCGGATATLSNATAGDMLTVAGLGDSRLALDGANVLAALSATPSGTTLKAVDTTTASWGSGVATFANLQLSGLATAAGGGTVLITGVDSSGTLRLLLYSSGTGITELALASPLLALGSADSPIGLAAGRDHYLLAVEGPAGIIHVLSLPFNATKATDVQFVQSPFIGQHPQVAFDDITTPAQPKGIFALSFVRNNSAPYTAVVKPVTCIY